MSAIFLNGLTEQYVKEQKDTTGVSDTVTDLDTNALEISEKVSQSKTSFPLSQADDVNELVLQDSLPDDITADVTADDGGKTEEMDTSKESVTAVTVYGSSFCKKTSIITETFFLNLMSFLLAIFLSY